MTAAEPGVKSSVFVFKAVSALMFGDHNVQNNYFELQFPDPVETAVQELGSMVDAQWRQEAAMRGLCDPEPIPVRWREGSIKQLGDHRRLTGDPVAGSVADLPAFADRFTGTLKRRLVVLGKAGSGKTTLAVLLVIELLQQMGKGDPVPVLLSLASWKPRREHLKTWLERQLVYEYPSLALGTVRTIVAKRRVLPVLDGLDELPAADQPVALRKLNRVLGEGGPLVLTCRTKEYAKAIKRDPVIRAAAVVQAEPLTAQEVSDYLLRSATPQHQEYWDPLVQALVQDPSSTVARVLKGPLMLWLCRQAYARLNDEEGPGDLATSDRFPTRKAIETHLLKSLVPSVYSSDPPPPPQPGRREPDGLFTDARRPDVKQVTDWLGHLARHLQQRGKPSLAWWQLGTTMGLFQRMLLIGLMSGLAVGLVVGPTDAIINGLTYPAPGHGLGYRLWLGLQVGFVDALVNGVPAGLVFALAHGIGTMRRGAALEPSRVWTPIGSKAEGSGARSPREILARAGIGALAGLGAGVGIGALEGLVPTLILWNAHELLIGLVYVVLLAGPFALAGGLIGALMAWLEAPIAVEIAPGPRDLLDRNRRTVRLQLLMFAPPLGIVSAAGVWLSDELLHHCVWGIGISWTSGDSLRFAFLTALGGGLGSGLSLTAWGQWMVVARVWLPLRGKLPWDTMAFLEDAHQRGVLRQVGAVYEFRHARLQEHFAQAPQQRKRRDRPTGDPVD
ncbi:NACHT domain-containing protein [Kitasatospora acidiphila]|uniref:NACHT domain-containing protein n=1 Tax=Kitasatospora acidiphila TaxID=2567942 RepID=UPI003C713F75